MAEFGESDSPVNYHNHLHCLHWWHSLWRTEGSLLLADSAPGLANGTDLSRYKIRCWTIFLIFLKILCSHHSHWSFLILTGGGVSGFLVRPPVRSLLRPSVESSIWLLPPFSLYFPCRAMATVAGFIIAGKLHNMGSTNSVILGSYNRLHIIIPQNVWMAVYTWGSWKGCEICTKQFKEVWGIYQAAKRGVRHVQGIYTWVARHLPVSQKGCEAYTKQLKGVQGMYKVSTRAYTRQLKEVQGIYKPSTRGARYLPGSQNVYKVCTWYLKGVQGMDKESTRGTRHLPGS